MKKILMIVSVLFLSVCIIRPAFSEEIKLRSTGGVYTVPVKLNNSFTMDFLIDTGAADVSLSENITGKLMSSGGMAERDFKGFETYMVADGSSVKCRSLMLHAVQVGGREVRDVKASSCPGNAPLLLGQSFLKKLGPWALDYSRETLVMMSEVKKPMESPAYTPKDIELQQNAVVQGDASAEFNLARIFFTGDGVPKDEKKAVELLQKSADKGYAPAQTVLGDFYRSGTYVPANKTKSFEMYQKAAAQGLPGGQTGLAEMYRSGEGVKKDITKALNFYQKAASQGDDIANTNLGLMYEFGDSVPKNPATAMEYFKKGADSGGLLSLYHLALAILNDSACYGGEKDTGKTPCTPEYTEGRDKQGVELMRKAAEGGLPMAQLGLGRLYYYGNSVTQDKVLAYGWMFLASERQVLGEKNMASDDLGVVEKELSPAELAQAKKLAANWKPGQQLKRN